MKRASKIVVGLIGVLHLYILVLEMFFWTSDYAMRTFATTPEFAQQTVAMAANQGLYNGFIAAGLFWGLFQRNPQFARQIQLFFLGCVAVAGIYGAVSVKLSILFVQTVPASLGLALVLASRRSESA